MYAAVEEDGDIPEEIVESTKRKHKKSKKSKTKEIRFDIKQCDVP